MGKRKIGEIYNKPIVEGDKNLVTNNEIHKSELSGGNSGGGSADVYMEYFGEDAVTALSGFSQMPPAVLLLAMGAGGVTSFLKSSDMIVPTLLMAQNDLTEFDLKGFAIVFGTGMVMNGQSAFVTPEVLNSGGMAGFYDLIKDHKITKEEFYSLD